MRSILGGARLMGCIAVVSGLMFFNGLAAANAIVNGGFETGSFSGWTQIGNTSFSGVQCPGAGFVPEGNCDAFFGPIGSTGGISQSFSTPIGAPVGIDFTFNSDGGTPGSFLAQFISGSTTTLLALTNPASAGNQTFHFAATANSLTSTIQFTFRDDPGFMFLDNVQVAVPEPASLALLSLGLAGLGFSRRKQS